MVATPDQQISLTDPDSCWWHQRPRVWHLTRMCNALPMKMCCLRMALHVLAYNLTRLMNIIGVQPIMAAIRAHLDRYQSRLICLFADPFFYTTTTLSQSNWPAANDPVLTRP